MVVYGPVADAGDQKRLKNEKTKNRFQVKYVNDILLLDLNRIMAVIWNYFHSPRGMALSSVFNTFQVVKIRY